jgi:hypothetical protein
LGKSKATNTLAHVLKPKESNATEWERFKRYKYTVLACWEYGTPAGGGRVRFRDDEQAKRLCGTVCQQSILFSLSCLQQLPILGPSTFDPRKLTTIQTRNPIPTTILTIPLLFRRKLDCFKTWISLTERKPSYTSRILSASLKSMLLLDVAMLPLHLLLLVPLSPLPKNRQEG